MSLIGPKDTPHLNVITLPEPRDAWAVEDISRRQDPPIFEIHRVQLLACRTYEPKGGQTEGSWWLGVSHPEEGDSAYLQWWEWADVYFSRHDAESYVEEMNQRLERV